MSDLQVLQAQFLQLCEENKVDSASKQRLLRETLNLLADDIPEADVKMVGKTLAEIRLGLDVFKPYQAWRKVSVFGSARTKPDHPQYVQTKACGKALKEAGFMVITGGGPGMMQAANEGAGREASFGVGINLPMEQELNPVVHESPRSFECQYFFTRKLFFLKESDAVILTPGGFGTFDEGFELLTLLQTGRNPPIPVIMLEAPGDDFWGPFLKSWMRRLLNDGLISPEDTGLLFHTDNADTAVQYIHDYYVNYHSFRYVGNQILLRLNNALSEHALARLNAEFSDVLHKGEIEQVKNWPENDDVCFAHYPRLRMRLQHHRMSVLPDMIRRMNALYLQD
ncbi:MAG: TIGR00730 family Rossman fold protein [Mariprofundaceae bacterium]|nr:TIGR00730 family Rossman fold protein [Mariprofundaceae bacterium]